MGIHLVNAAIVPTTTHQLHYSKNISCVQSNAVTLQQTVYRVCSC
jgi:hypothetical protein